MKRCPAHVLFALAVVTGACSETPLFPSGGGAGGSFGFGGMVAGSGGVPSDPAGGTGGFDQGSGGVAVSSGTGGVSSDRGPINDAGADAVPSGLPPTVQPRPYVDVQKTVSTCAETGGTPYSPASDAESASLLLGRWQLCSGRLPSDFMLNAAGLEFDRDRSWHTLIRTSPTTLAPATGIDNDGPWYMASEDPRDMVYMSRNILRMGFSSRGGNWGFPITFLKNPTRLRISVYAEYAWLGE